VKTARRRQWKTGLITGATLLFTGFGSAHAQNAPTAPEVDARIQTLVARVGELGASGRTYAAQDPRIHLASYKAALGRFGVAMQSFLNVTGDLARARKLIKDDKTIETIAPVYNARALTYSANRVAKAGLRLSRSLSNRAKAFKPTDHLIVSPANHPAHGLRSTLTDFVQALQEVPAKSLAPSQLRALNQVAEDTTILTTLLESVAPVLSGTRDTIKAEAR
jgi:hypothetical protein